MLIKEFLAPLLIFLFITISIYPQQEFQVKETESRVIELEQFHEIIYPIWHTAYPAKDFNALRNYAHTVDSLAAQIYSAKLPGILRDKKEKWDEGAAEFKKSVEEYDRQSAASDNEALLMAAEKLHSNYEKLFRTIRPVSKEVDEFHQLLYVVYHTYLPERQFEKIVSASDGLVDKAGAILKMKLPKNFEAKAEKINSASKELLSTANDLNCIKDAAKETEISLAVEKLHKKYQELSDIF